MTAPRQIVAGRTYLVTRRCCQRMFLLSPSDLTNQLIRYCLALAANQTGVLLHAFCFMSNHWHGVVTDPNARLPEFLERFHRLFARAQNTALGRKENLWSSEKPSVVWLVSEEDAVHAIAYTIANPTAAGLVASPGEWPGVITREVGESMSVDMPGVFFDAKGSLPAQIELKTHPLKLASPASKNRLGPRLLAAIKAMVEDAQTSIAAAGMRFVGATTILLQSFSAIPSSIEPRLGHRPVASALASRDRARALDALKRFVLDYRRAWQAWRGGARATLFPPGTYALRVYARVACAPILPLSA
jgi:putative transposase